MQLLTPFNEGSKQFGIAYRISKGSFSYFAKTRTNKSGVTLKDYSLVMEVSQKTIDSFILVAIQQFFGAGNVYHGTNGVSRLRISTREDIVKN